jgi:hypothetical protein
VGVSDTGRKHLVGACTMSLLVPDGLFIPTPTTIWSVLYTDNFAVVTYLVVSEYSFLGNTKKYTHLS